MDAGCLNYQEIGVMLIVEEGRSGGEKERERERERERGGGGRERERVNQMQLHSCNKLNYQYSNVQSPHHNN